jgi:F0F1-type ATP synthase assembly protein I
MGHDEDVEPRRRTAFEQDLRELFLKLVLSAVAGVVLRVWTGWESWWLPMIIGGFAVFFLASLIKGDGRHSD